jgi:hypothetical protein
MPTALSTYAYGAARSLGLPVNGDPVEAVIQHCELRVESFARKYGCTTLDDLRMATADGLKTNVVHVRTDRELSALHTEYVSRGELGFGQLPTDLGPTVYGQTIRLLAPMPGERRYVSVIDARGDKVARACFTEWHEHAHLLTLTNPLADKFQRSHSRIKPPEESLMDAIAGRVGFLDSVFRPHLPKVLRLEAIGATRAAACSTASWPSLFHALGRFWRTPVLVIRAEVAVKRALEIPPGQGSFGFYEPPPGELRAIRVTPNDEARGAGFRIHPRMRVPERSVISRVLQTGIPEEAAEDLAWWESSQAGPLDAWPVHVLARPSAGGVDAMVVATPEVADGDAGEGTVNERSP